MALYDVTIGGSGGVKLRTSRHRVNEADVLRAVGCARLVWLVQAAALREAATLWLSAEARRLCPEIEGPWFNSPHESAIVVVPEYLSRRRVQS